MTPPVSKSCRRARGGTEADAGREQAVQAERDTRADVAERWAQRAGITVDRAEKTAHAAREKRATLAGELLTVRAALTEARKRATRAEQARTDARGQQDRPDRG